MNLRESCKAMAKRALLDTKVLRFATGAFPRNIAILKYHSIRDDPDACDGSIGTSIVHSTKVFEEQMEIVARHYDPVSMDDVARILRGEQKAPKRPVAVTFDDGYADNCEIAAPLLDRFGVPATFYVTVGSVRGCKAPWFVRVRHALWTTKRNDWIDKESGCTLQLAAKREDRVKLLRAMSRLCSTLTGDAQEEVVQALERELDVSPFGNDGLMMSWDQMRELNKRGHAIGSHTLSHPNVAYISADEMRAELIESKRMLEKELGAPVLHFSYPHPFLTPNFSPATTSVAKEAGYRTAVLSINGPVARGGDPYCMERVTVASDRRQFVWNLESTLLGRRT